MNLFVSNVGCHIDNADLKLLFTPFGEVISAHIEKDKDTGKSLRYGFVEMPDINSAQEAIGKLNGRVVEGRPLSVNVARANARHTDMHVRPAASDFNNRYKRTTSRERYLQ